MYLYFVENPAIFQDTIWICQSFMNAEKQREKSEIELCI